MIIYSKNKIVTNIICNLLKRFNSTTTKLKIQPNNRIEKNDLIDNYETKLLKVAIIGTPNAGKSTFINSLVNSQLCPTSKKVHTTRKAARAVLTENNTQIIFVDTPGLVSFSELRKYNLEKSFVRDRTKCLNEVDLIGIIHDAHNPYTRETLDQKLLKTLEKYKHLPSFLVLNKIDLLTSKRKLLDLVRSLTDNCINGIGPFPSASEKNSESRWKHFSEIFMVSSLTSDGIEDVKNFLLTQSKLSPWVYNNQERTDQSDEDIIVNTVKATLLDFLPQEIPYRLKTELEFFQKNDEDGSIQAVVLVKCPSSRIEKLIVGVSDGKLKQINAVAQRSLVHAFYCNVSLKIVTFV